MVAPRRADKLEELRKRGDREQASLVVRKGLNGYKQGHWGSCHNQWILPGHFSCQAKSRLPNAKPTIQGNQVSSSSDH